MRGLRLDQSGIIVLTVGLVITAVGVGAGLPFVAAWGEVILTLVALIYVLTLRQAVRAQSHIVSVVCDVPTGPGGGLVAGGRFDVPLRVSNHGRGTLPNLEVGLVTSNGIQVLEPARRHVLPGRSEIDWKIRALAMRVGPAFVHGVHVGVTGPLRLFRYRTWLPLSVAVKILPRTASPRSRSSLLTIRAADRDAISAAAQPVRGLGSDLRELREHVAGDLIVKEFESEISLSVYALLDIGASMRWGRPGETRLDTAIDLTFHLARTVNSGRDRFGLASFDGDVFGFTRAQAGHRMPKQVMAHLLELHAVTHEDFTEVAPDDLIARVAEFMVAQEGARVVLPALTPAETRAGVGSYDSEGVMQRVHAFLAEHETELRALSHYFSAPSADPTQAALRTYCRLRGLDLPYRTEALPAPRHQGLSRAVQKAIQDRGGGPHTLVAITDLVGIEDAAPLLGVVRLARSHRHRMIFVLPEDPALQAGEAEPTSFDGKIRETLRSDQVAHRAKLSAALRSQGVPVYSLGPSLTGVVGAARMRGAA